MLSRYGIFCKVAESGSFTRVAESVGYTQSAVSQTVKALEKETGVALLERGKEGVRLTQDGRFFLPYFKAIAAAELDFEESLREFKGLENSLVRIGTFTGISRNFLPPLLRSFKDEHPGVSFILKQGEYSSISEWILAGEVDFGFVDPDALKGGIGLEFEVLFSEKMEAVLSPENPLAKEKELTLGALANETFILLDEGDYSVAREAFLKCGLSPKIEYEVSDDYTILSMVRQGLGISLMYENVLAGFSEDLAVRPIKDAPARHLAMSWRKWDTLPFASRKFVEHIRAALYIRKL